MPPGSTSRLPTSAHASFTGPSKNCMNPHTGKLCQWHICNLHPRQSSSCVERLVKAFVSAGRAGPATCGSNLKLLAKPFQALHAIVDPQQEHVAASTFHQLLTV